MSFDWPSFLRTNRIEFNDRGPSTSRGNIYIHCPFCGAADKGHHMGISLEGKGWGCWRNPAHRGKSEAKLISRLLGIGFAQASELVGSRRPMISAGQSLSERVRKALGSAPVLADEISELHFPKELRPLTDSGYGRRFIDYLIQERGFKQWQVDQAIKTYKLRYAVEGLFAFRLIIPVYSDENGLETWTGRSIIKDESLRYLSLTSDREKAEFYGLPPARRPITDCLFNERELMRDSGKALIVCEGPLDAMPLDLWMREHRIRATALFGKALSHAQADKLAEMGEGYKKKLLLLDSSATLDAYSLISRLEPFGFKVAKLPEDWKDPGAEHHRPEFREFIREIVK